MNPVIFGPDAEFAYVDGIYFSGHKFLGGCGSPGVLIVKKNILTPSDVQPTQPGADCHSLQSFDVDVQQIG